MKKTAVSAKEKNGSGNLFFLTGIIVIITFFVLSPVLRNEFINWDDNAYVFQNPHLNKSFSEAVKFFFGPNYFIGNYIPVTMIVYKLEYSFAGLKPSVFHLVNLIIHLLNVILVFRLTYLLSEKKVFVAVFVSLLFGIHPLHVESVAWVAELKDVLYCFFFLLGLIYYQEYSIRKKQNALKNASVSLSRNDIYSLLKLLLLFLLAVLSKPAAIIFPLVLLLLDFYNHRKFEKWVWIEKIPFLIISILFGIVAIIAQQNDNLLHNDHSFFDRFLFASHSFLNYIVKFVLPFNLSIFYPYPERVNGLLPLLYYLAPFFVLILCYGVYKSLKYSRLVAFGFLFFFVNVTLVLQLVSVGDAIMAERYTYVSYIGLFFIVAMTIDRFYQTNKKNMKPNTVIIMTCLLVLLSFSYLSYSRAKVWKNDETIANDLLSKYPNDRLVLNNKGYILFERKQYEESIKLFARAIQLKPDYSMAYINLINSYLSLNDIDNALKTADTALKHVPEDFNLLNKKAVILLSQRNYSEAVKYFEKSLSIQKDDIDNYIRLSECYFWLKDYKAGVKTLDVALGIDPSNYILLNNKGYFLFVMRKYEQAIPLFKEALKIKPDYSTASINLRDANKALIDSVKPAN